MSRFPFTRSIRVIGALTLVVVPLAGCTGDRADTCSEPSVLRASGEVAPLWADRWIVLGGGAVGGGQLTIADGDDAFTGVYACVGLRDSPWIELSDGAGTPSESEVRVGLDDYLYRAGEAIVDGEKYSVDVVVVHTDSSTRGFGLAFAPAARSRVWVDEYVGASVVQQMRELSVL